MDTAVTQFTPGPVTGYKSVLQLFKKLQYLQRESLLSKRRKESIVFNMLVC